jgi:hypothetical protein
VLDDNGRRAFRGPGTTVYRYNATQKFLVAHPAAGIILPRRIDRRLQHALLAAGYIEKYESRGT